MRRQKNKVQLVKIMKNQITIKNLESVVLRINKLTGSPESSYTKNANGKFTANIGNYHLDGAYGGYALHRMQSIGGGVQDIFHGHFTKRELSEKMFAFIAGIEATQKPAN